MECRDDEERLATLESRLGGLLKVTQSHTHTHKHTHKYTHTHTRMHACARTHDEERLATLESRLSTPANACQRP